MSTAPRYIPRYTVEDYSHWEGDRELIDGVPISMSPSPFGSHERVVPELSRQIANQLIEQSRHCRTIFHVTDSGEVTIAAAESLSLMLENDCGICIPCGSLID